jgi:hypothetical protein
MMDIEKRKIAQRLRAAGLRAIAEINFTKDNLLELFGLAIKNRITSGVSRHEQPGKNYFNAHGAGHNAGGSKIWQHIAGTKFVRACIRLSGRESTYSRELYKLMTGVYYKGEGSASTTSP